MRRRTSSGLAVVAVLLAGLPALTIATPAAAASVAGEVYLTTPTKILDTRSGLGAPKRALGAKKTLVVKVAGKGGVPATGAAAAVLQVTAVTATAATSLTVWPYGTARPATPNLVVARGRSSSVQLTGKLGSGKVDVYNAAGSVQLTVHTEGWSTTGATATAGSRLAPLSSRRILDTRSGLGAAKASVGARRTLTFAVAGKGGVPSTGVAAAALDITAVSASKTTALTVFPAGSSRPATPNVYVTPGRTVATAVLAKLGKAGKVSVYNSAGTVHVVADVQGAFRTSYGAGGRLTPLRPARLARTTVGAGKTAVVTVAGRGGVPATHAAAAALSLTGSGATRATALTVYPYGATRPATPNLYLSKGGSATNAVLAKLGTGGKVAVYNSAGSTTVAVDVQGAYVVPAPVAPPSGPSTITTTGAHSLYEEASWLFTGSNPPQAGVAAGTIKPDLIGVIRGGVSTKAGTKAVGVAISVLHHPELGVTHTDANGEFSIAVNAGGPLTVGYALDGYTSGQRLVSTKAQQYLRAADVALVPMDTKVTAVNLTAGNPVAAVSSTVTDSDGTRTNAVIVPEDGTTATATKPDGSTVQLPSTLHLRATEYTVGTTGPEQMPGVLPASSGYTYAVDLTVDEAEKLDATNVSFSHPLANYVDNFLGFPVGTAVPAGYYDEQKAVWVASKNGVVVKLLSVDGTGKAVLDTDGDGAADSAGQYDALGITDDERTRLAGTYTAGKTLWRVPITHFTPWDYNWPYGLPDDATNWEKTCMASGGTPAKCKEDAEKLKEKYCNEEGSIIGCENQTLGESVPITGTKLHLRYSSGVVPGRSTNRRVRIPLTFASMPGSFLGGQLLIDVAGEHVEHNFGPAPNQTYTFVWDGMDGFGRPVNGEQEATIQIGYKYPAVYKESATALEASFAVAGGDDLAGNSARTAITIWHTITAHLGSLAPDTDALGNWSIDVHHSYDPETQTVHYGNGTTHSAVGASQGVISTLRLSGQSFVDPQDAVAGADGSVFVADPGADKIWKVSPAGVVSTYAGTGTEGYQGDDGQATAAQLFDPTYLATGPDGSLYLTDGSGAQISRVRRIAPSGVITTVAGTFNDTYNGDGIPATDANLFHPQGIAVGVDGSLYIADTGDNRVRRVNPNGIITTVAGNGDSGETGDGAPAVEARVEPTDVAVGADGTVYVSTFDRTIRAIGPDGDIRHFAGDPAADPGSESGDALTAGIDPAYLSMTSDGTLLFTDQATERLRQITPDGQIATLAGKASCGDEPGDGGPPLHAPLCSPRGVASVAGVTTIVENSFATLGLRRIGSLWPGFQLGDTTIASPDGAEVWVFDQNGRQKRTLDAVTGAVRWQFGYDTDGRLTSITDGYGNATTVHRDSVGTATSITAPGGQVTQLTVDAAHNLTAVTNPVGSTVALGYGSGGLLTSYRDPLDRTTTFGYDADGRLTSDTEPGGAVTTLSRTATDDTSTVTTTGPDGQVTVFFQQLRDDGSVLARRTDPTGGVRTIVTSADGLTTTTTEADGTRTVTRSAPDARWGMQAPFASEVAVTLPSNRSFTRAATQDVTLADPADPLSMTSLTTTDTRAGKTVTETYDAATRTRTRTTPGGRTSTLVFDAHGRPVSYRMDAGVDPVAWDYDTHGRLVSQSQGDRTTTFGYDAQNRVVSRTTSAGATTYGYDAADRMTSTTTPGARHYAFGYDAAGNRTAVTMPNGSVHTLTYSPRGELAGYQPPGNPAYQRSYDDTGRIKTVTMPSGATQQFGYDSGDRDTGVTYPEAATAITYVPDTRQPAAASWTPAGGAEERTAWTYDGPFVTATAKTGTSVASFAYSYDAGQAISSVRVDSGADSVTRDITRDDDGLVVGDGPFAISRSGPGGLTSGITDGTLSVSQSYDASARPATRDMSVGGASVYSSSVGYDSTGRVSSFAETDAGGTTTYDYTYDADGRLTGVDKDGSPVAAYTYDSRGNRLTSGDPDHPVSATYDAQDRLTTSGATSYSYDTDGLLTGRGTDTFDTSRRGELLAAHVGGNDVTYAYDSQRRRVSRTQDGNTTQYFYGDPDQDTLVTETRAPSGQLTDLFYDSARHLYAMKRGADVYYVATDTLGSPRVVTDATGTVVDRIDYDAWGGVVSESDPSVDLVVGFAGGLRDRLTGLVRFGLRDYDPETGRWTARDPLFYGGQQLNLYEYVASAPTTFVDPTGEAGISIGGSFCLGICIEASINIGTNGIQACAGTGVGIGEGVDVGFTPGDVDTDTGIYAGASAGVGPFSASVKVMQTLCGSSTEWEVCAAPVCVNKDTFEKGELPISVDPSDLGEDVKDLYNPKNFKLEEDVEVKATIGGCAGTKY